LFGQRINKHGVFILIHQVGSSIKPCLLNVLR
jgi:hypothetical protein